MSIERRDFIDLYVQMWEPFFTNQSCGILTKMTFTAERMILSAKSFGLHNDDEKAYFYIKMIDPEFLMLEAYESANTKEELMHFCINNFGFYDKFLIGLEKKCNKRFNLIEIDELWSRERIKKGQ